MPAERPSGKNAGKNAGKELGTESGVGQDVFVEHRDLNAILAEVRSSFHDPHAAAAECERLAGAFDVHFEQEDRLYYPAIGSMRPELSQSLRAISEGHDGFRARLERVRAQLESGELGAARQGFESLASDFGEHEAAEEQLLADLDRRLVASL